MKYTPQVRAGHEEVAAAAIREICDNAGKDLMDHLKARTAAAGNKKPHPFGLPMSTYQFWQGLMLGAGLNAILTRRVEKT